MREKEAKPIKPGDQVFYVPHADHWHEVDRNGQSVFRFVMAEDGPPAPHGIRGKHAGDELQGPMHKWGFGQMTKRDPDGTLHFESGHKVKVGAARSFWEGTVGEEIERTPREVDAIVDGKTVKAVIYDEVKRLVLNVPHPNGFGTLHLPLDGPCPVVHDPTGQKPHSYHRAGEGGEK